MTTASAPGKIILLGEHAVVYGRPAIAVPVRQVEACAHIEAAQAGSSGEIFLEAPDLGLSGWLREAPDGQPLAAIVRATLEKLGHPDFPALRLRLESTIPIASGLGSSAAVSIAVARALAAHLGSPLSDRDASDLAFEVERLHHGTPSGIDNTVVAFDRPVYFVKGGPPETFVPGGSFEFLIGDTGIPAPTAQAVAEVRAGWEAARGEFEATFDSIADLVVAARAAIVAGNPVELGTLMDQNHDLLVVLGVTSPELDLLADAARSAGALGAKMSGGGKGGNMIAAVTPETVPSVTQALYAAGAVSVLHTEVGP